MLPVRKPVEQAGAEVRQLRACINDLIGVVALPSIWSRTTPADIVRTHLEALFSMLRLDFVYLRLNHSVGDSPLELVRVQH